MRELNFIETTGVSGGMTIFGAEVYTFGNFAGDWSNSYGGGLSGAPSSALVSGGGGMTWGDVAIISGVISAGAFSASAIPSPATLALVFVGLTTAGIAGLAQYIDNHSKKP